MSRYVCVCCPSRRYACIRSGLSFTDPESTTPIGSQRWRVARGIQADILAQCSGGHPCSRCLKRRTACSYPDAQDTASPKHFILVNASGTPRPRSAASPAVPLADERLRLVGAFDLFARRNSFTGKTATCGDEVRALAGLHAGESGHLWEAMMALGAVYEARLGGEAALRKSRMVTALGHYARAISGLRTAIDKGMSGRRRGKSPAPEQTSILWTTLFLGLFEVR